MRKIYLMFLFIIFIKGVLFGSNNLTNNLDSTINDSLNNVYQKHINSLNTKSIYLYEFSLGIHNPNATLDRNFLHDKANSIVLSTSLKFPLYKDLWRFETGIYMYNGTKINIWGSSDKRYEFTEFGFIFGSELKLITMGKFNVVLSQKSVNSFDSFTFPISNLLSGFSLSYYLTKNVSIGFSMELFYNIIEWFTSTSFTTGYQPTAIYRIFYNLNLNLK